MVTENWRIQFLRGTEDKNDTYRGAEGELTVDATNDTLRLHDGETHGGVEIGGYGRVVESDSNANGTYVRFSDGTQITYTSCVGINLLDSSTFPDTVLILNGKGGRVPESGDDKFYFRVNTPARFLDMRDTINEVVTYASINSEGKWFSPRVGGTVSTYGPMYFYNNEPIGTGKVTIRLMAIGRWF